MAYGYDGISTERVTAVDLRTGKRRVLCWGDAITQAEIQPFVDYEFFCDARIEPVDDPGAEMLAYPIYEGRA